MYPLFSELDAFNKDIATIGQNGFALFTAGKTSIRGVKVSLDSSFMRLIVLGTKFKFFHFKLHTRENGVLEIYSQPKNQVDLLNFCSVLTLICFLNFQFTFS